MDLLIHDLTAEEWKLVSGRYEGWNVVSASDGIRPCVGCFHCWTSGTGECVFKDGYHRMCALIHEAHEMVVMSRYTYGGFSSSVKGVFDRCIGYVLPEFEVAYGEMHHQKRFPEDKPVTFIFRGAGLLETQKNKAREYVAAVCRNLRGSVKDVVFEECAAEEPSKTAGAADRSGLLFINSSLRGEGSNTGLLLKKLQECLGVQAEIISLLNKQIQEKAAEAMSRAETVIFGAPLYVDGLPATALQFIEKVRASGAAAGCKLYAVVNNGLYESLQNINMLSMIKDFCTENGILYKGSAAIGAGEMIGTLMRVSGQSLWPARNAIENIKNLAKAIESDLQTEDIYADPFMFPRGLYIKIANANWQKLKKAYGNPNL